MPVKRKSLLRMSGGAVGASALLVGSWALFPAATPAAETAETAAGTGAAAEALADPLADEPIGYAAMEGGTTGGFGPATTDEVVLSEYVAESGIDSPAQALYELLNEHQDNEDGGLVVYVDTTVTQDGFDEGKIDVKDVTDVSILGVGTSGEFDNVGFKVTRSSNIVFRNLQIHHVHDGEGDAIEITDDSHHVWVDHNEFFSELETAPDKDYYDGLVDIKRNSEYITVSWNDFHDHWKVSLIGHNDSEGSAADKVTYHHNRFANVNTRVPLIRHADVHMLNNVMEDVTGSAINARMGAEVLVEGNYFENVGSGEIDSHADYPEGPVGWFYGSSETGYWNLQDNEFVDSPHEHLESTTDFTVPYDYTAHTPAEARELVAENAGIGVIDVTP